MTGDKMKEIVRDAFAMGLEQAADLALSIDSNRGNEKQIAEFCRDAAAKIRTGEIVNYVKVPPNA